MEMMVEQELADAAICIQLMYRRRQAYLAMDAKRKAPRPPRGTKKPAAEMEKRHAAAVKLQKIQRGKAGRSQVAAKKEGIKATAAIKIQSLGRQKKAAFRVNKFRQP